MPELPEVEVTRRGIAPFVEGATVDRVIVRNRRLRWPVPRNLERTLLGATARAVDRRAKYLLIRFDHGTLIVHLGMSGSLRVVGADEAAGPWDHFDLVMRRPAQAGARTEKAEHTEARAGALRLRDPRRFGAVLWQAGPPEAHALLRDLGVEPLTADFSGKHLYAASRGRSAAVKLFLMDHSVVVGIGNIYASESLFRARIDPRRPAGRISSRRYETLAAAVRDTLLDALKAGGSTLRDFVGGDGQPGYFQQQYFVYGREGEPCRVCGGTIRRITQGQRSTFYCPRCQR